MVLDAASASDFARPWALSAHHDTQEAFLFARECTMPSITLLADWVDGVGVSSNSKTSVDASTRSSATAREAASANADRDPAVAKTFRLIRDKKFTEAKRYFAANAGKDPRWYEAYQARIDEYRYLHAWLIFQSFVQEANASGDASAKVEHELVR